MRIKYGFREHFQALVSIAAMLVTPVPLPAVLAFD
jgi:hypothetical protein